MKSVTYGLGMHTEAGLDSGSGRVGPRRIERPAAALAERFARAPRPIKLSEIDRLGGGVGEGNRTPDLQNHNLAL
jgi:hypothetical protein